MSEDIRIVSMFLQGKSADEIAQSLNVDKERVEKVIKNVLGALSREFGAFDVKFKGIEDELLGLYLVQKRRVLAYVMLEKELNMPLPETKDNLIILIKILEVMWRTKGERFSIDKLKEDLFSLEGEKR